MRSVEYLIQVTRWTKPFISFFPLLVCLNKRNPRPVHPACAEWRLLFIHFIWTLARVQRCGPGVQVTTRRALMMDRRKTQVKDKIMNGEQRDDLKRGSDAPLYEGRTVVRRFIMLEKLDLIIAIVKRSREESSCYAPEVIWSHFFTSMDHYFQRQFK